MECPLFLNKEWVNDAAILPYGLALGEIDSAVARTYKFFYGLNYHLESSNQRPLEEMLLSSNLSGMISEVVVRHIAEQSTSLLKNDRVGGHPDLLPVGVYETTDIQRGNEGIEIKASTHKGGWQGHNPEASWLMVFRYETKPVGFRFTEILCAKLEETDWSFSGRKEGSRRTPTASINIVGMNKLRDNYIYRIPGYGVGKHRA